MSNSISEKASMRKGRTTGSLGILFLLVAMIAIFRFANDVIAWITGRNPAEIADMGPEVLQTMPVVAMHICFATLLSTGIAMFVERQLKENAFGQWSRFGVVFSLVFWGYCQIAGGLL